MHAAFGGGVGREGLWWYFFYHDLAIWHVFFIIGRVSIWSICMFCSLHVALFTWHLYVLMHCHLTSVLIYCIITWHLYEFVALHMTSVCIYLKFLLPFSSHIVRIYLKIQLLGFHKYIINLSINYITLFGNHSFEFDLNIVLLFNLIRIGNIVFQFIQVYLIQELIIAPHYSVILISFKYDSFV